METCSKDPNNSSAEPEEEVLSTAQFIEAFGYPFKVVTFYPGNPHPRTRTIPNAAAATDILSLVAHENKTLKANNYFEVNHGNGANQRSASNDIRFLRAVPADIDAKDGRTLEDCLAIVDGLPLEPSILVFSGGGYQPLYLLKSKVDKSQGTLQGRRAKAGRTHGRRQRQRPTAPHAFTGVYKLATSSLEEGAGAEDGQSSERIIATLHARRIGLAVRSRDAVARGRGASTSQAGGEQ